MDDNGQVDAGSLADLERDGMLLTKVGSLPVLVVWDGEQARAIEDRCPHLGFPLHRGTVDDGLVTCHWHHARFDLTTGCTLDPWADDAQGFDVEVRDGHVLVRARPDADAGQRWERRLRDGLEQQLTLVTAKAVLGLLEADPSPAPIVRTALRFGTTYRRAGWGAGLTVLVAMANVLAHLAPRDRPLALVHALTFVSRDTAGRPPRFAEPSLGDGHDPARLKAWYRRFVDTRSADAAERVLATLVASGDLPACTDALVAAATDHVFLDEGHTLDFTNKALESVALVGPGEAGVLTSLVAQTCGADRAEESAAWRHPVDLGGLVADAERRLPGALVAGRQADPASVDVAGVAWAILDDDPVHVVEAVLRAATEGATPEQLGRAVAYAAALRVTRFHLNNDPGDWDTVHHAFTYANGLHQCLVRQPSPELLRGVLHGALRVHLDRFLNIPAARLPEVTAGSLEALESCWDVQGQVDEAGAEAYGFLRGGGRRDDLLAALGHALVQEDAEFHWFQIYEAGLRQALAWPEGSEESALVLTGVARFLAAHTPTRRELPTVVRTAARLRRGDALFEGTDGV